MLTFFLQIFKKVPATHSQCFSFLNSYSYEALHKLVCVCESLSHVRLFATPWTVAHQAPLSMEFSRQEYWSGSPFPSSGYLLNPGIEPGSSALQADSLPSERPPVFRSAVIETQLLFPLSSEERENNDLLSMIIMNNRHHQGYQKYITFHRFHLIFAQVL